MLLKIQEIYNLLLYNFSELVLRCDGQCKISVLNTHQGRTTGLLDNWGQRNSRKPSSN